MRAFLLLTLGLVACAEEHPGPSDAGRRDASADATVSDVGLAVDAARDAVIASDATSNDAALHSDATTVDSSVPEDADVLVDATVEDASLADASLTDAASGPSAVSLCEVDSMESLYSGFFPTNPYEAPPAATSCMRERHDAIIVLGCPNNEDGSPAPCQTERADIAVALWVAGFGDTFIVSGAAVHNAYVEAHTLRDLLVARSVPADRIVVEDHAQHTDENIYYSSLLMAERGWQNALVVSEDPGHLIMSAVCDSNCCVDLGRLTVAGFPVVIGASEESKAIAHYVLYPYATEVTGGECSQIELPTKLMCTNLSSRHACAGMLML